jgi:predicted enzyme related to lactoylglutathione lyase
MKRATGIGGVFFKSKDPKALYAWYEKHLGIQLEPHGQGAVFKCSDDPDGMTAWSIFPADTEYFGPGPQTFMLNFRVADLDALLAALKAEGVTIDPKREDADYGRFAWIVDPDGNRIELWEPK